MKLGEFLQTLEGRKVFFDPLHGNHGDSLLTLAAQMLLADAGADMVADPAAAGFILLNGGGSMVDGWHGLQKLRRFCRMYPRTPLAVLPSSFHFPRTRLVDIVGRRSAPMWLWARERTSLDLLRRAGLESSVTLAIDHDLAFFLAGTPFIDELKSHQPDNSLLIVERDDWEGPTGRRRVLSPPGLDFIPEKFRTAVRRHMLGPLRKRQDQASPFRKAALDFVRQYHPEAAGMPSYTGDISLPEVCDFDAFLDHVARSSIIVTARLHVAIIAHLLNRRTYLVDGSYHKFRGVFEYSMRGGSTALIHWDNGRSVLVDDRQSAR
jgi:exopolysaccharide biosynthesis predicted pyruvyltransferase EpsI